MTISTIPKVTTKDSLLFVKNRLDTLNRLGRDFHDIVKISKSFYFIFDPLIVKQVFKGSNIQPRSDALGRDFNASDNKRWLDFRTQFSQNFVKSKCDEFRLQVDNVAGSVVSTGSINVVEIMQKLMSNLTSMYVLGDNTGSVPKYVREVIKLTVRRHSSLLTVATPFSFPTPLNLRTHRAEKQLHDEIAKVWSENHSRDSNIQNDLRVLPDLLAPIIAAGTLPPANTLAWIWHLLEENPAVERRLHGLLHEQPDQAQVYVRKIVTEALRLYPSNIIVQAVTTQDVELENYLIPKGVDVAYSPFFIHRDERLWRDPEVFEPNREGHQKNPAYLPFGIGPSACLGANLARVILEESILAIAARFSLRKTPSADPTIVPYLSITTPKKMMMSVEARKQAP